MKKRILPVILTFGMIFTSMPAVNVSADNGVPMYRMYNYHSGEHFYTSNAAERNHLLVAGWDYEGVGWTAPSSGQNVYRLYNPNAGDHHYTTNKGEKSALVRLDWRDEGIGWKSDTTKAVPLYREYNPNSKSGTHNYTTSKGENDVLVRLGWNYEGIGWYGVNDPTRGETNVPDGGYFVELTTGEYAMSPAGFVQNMKYSENELTFHGQVLKDQKSCSIQDYTFQFADDCLYYDQPTDVAPRAVMSRESFNRETLDSWRMAGGSNSMFIYLNVQNGYVTYAYITG